MMTSMRTYLLDNALDCAFGASPEKHGSINPGEDVVLLSPLDDNVGTFLLEFAFNNYSVGEVKACNLGPTSLPRRDQERETERDTTHRETERGTERQRERDTERGRERDRAKNTTTNTNNR